MNGLKGTRGYHFLHPDICIEQQETGLCMTFMHSPFNGLPKDVNILSVTNYLRGFHPPYCATNRSVPVMISPADSRPDSSSTLMGLRTMYARYGASTSPGRVHGA